MTFAVYTARMGLRDPDYLDITRAQPCGQNIAGGHRGIGLAFAPSLVLLKHYLKIRAENEATKELPDADWARYSNSYMIEMRESWVRKRAAWQKLAQLERVVLLCFCTSRFQCHRFVLAEQILPKLGGDYHGEIEPDGNMQT